jgi:hypothetical protein
MFKIYFIENSINGFCFEFYNKYSSLYKPNLLMRKLNHHSHDNLQGFVSLKRFSNTLFTKSTLHCHIQIGKIDNGLVRLRTQIEIKPSNCLSSFPKIYQWFKNWLYSKTVKTTYFATKRFSNRI